MTSFSKLYQLDAAYCAAIIKSDNNRQLSWLGNYFDWQQCLNSNFIDLNCFMVSRLMLNKKGILFDENLERFVDWDLILGVTYDSRVAFLDCALVNYYNGTLVQRITTHEYIGKEQEVLKYIRSKHDHNKNNVDALSYRKNSYFFQEP
tara:strand:- start:133 stop:576 length:444 start_codon:yes stop_codon:yes gene_type:complete